MSRIEQGWQGVRTDEAAWPTEHCCLLLRYFAHLIRGLVLSPLGNRDPKNYLITLLPNAWLLFDRVVDTRQPMLRWLGSPMQPGPHDELSS